MTVAGVAEFMSTLDLAGIALAEPCAGLVAGALVEAVSWVPVPPALLLEPSAADGPIPDALALMLPLAARV